MVTETCDACPEEFDPDAGCSHDERRLCAADLHLCPECSAGIADDYAAELSMDRGR